MTANKKPIFVIQEHNAQKHHYDFRLEINGTLASWAVPKGLSTIPNEKHLAIKTPNHPLSYAQFEGIIPEGEYGAGKVSIFDKGHYKPVLDNKTMQQGLKDGALKIHLHGKKFKGDYALARISDDNSPEKWIIFKVREKHVQTH